MNSNDTELKNRHTRLSAGLRELAEFLDANPEFPNLTLGTCFGLKSKDELVKYSKMFKTFEKNAIGGFYNVNKYFGPVKIQLYVSRDLICTRTQIDEKWVEGKPLVPATEGHMEPVYEYDCPEHLLSPNEKDKS